MMERILNKDNLVSFGLLTLLFHSATSLLQYLVNINGVMVADYILLGLMSAATILYLGKQHIPIRFQPAQVLLILLMIWMIVSCVSMSITYNNDWVSYNIINLLNAAVEFFLAFPLGYILIREKKNALGRILLHVLLISWTAFILFVLVNVFQGNTMISSNNTTIGMQGNHLYLGCYFNTSGAWELLFFLTCYFMIFWSKQLSFRLIYGISAVIHFAALSLTNSRTSIVSALLGFVALTGIMIYLRREEKQRPQKILLSAAVAIVAGVAFYFLSGFMLKLYNYCTSSTVSVRSTVENIAGDTTFNGRTRIWQATITGIFSSFRIAMFGVTPQSVPDFVNQMTDGAFNMYTHNQFLEIAAGIGIPGLCIFLAWFFIMIKDIFQLIFVQKNKTLFLFVPVMILVLILSNMMEAIIVILFYFSGLAFFLLCGILHGKVNEPIKPGEFPKWIGNMIKRKKKE